MAARVRVRVSQGKGARERERVASACFYPPSRRSMATVAKRFVGDGGEPARSLQREDDDTFPETACFILIYLQKGPSANFSNLNEVLRQFHKFYKNSYGPPLSFRSFPKIGVAK